MPTITHILFNPNQLRNFGTVVQYKPSSIHPLTIRTASSKFYMQIETQGTNIYANTSATTRKELEDILHIVMYLKHEFNPSSINFHISVRTLYEEQYHIWVSTGISTIKYQRKDEFISSESDWWKCKFLSLTGCVWYRGNKSKDCF